MSQDEFVCRICLDDGVRLDFIAPCACSGSSKWVHRTCLDRWRSTREDKAFSKCTECLKPYELICTADEGPKCCRQTRFICLVARDFFIALFSTQVLIAIFGYIAFASDYRDKALVEFFHMQNHHVIFYYCFSLTLILAVVGMVFSCAKAGCCDSCGRVCEPCAHCCGGYSPYYYQPYTFWYFGDTSAASGETCCCCCQPCECGSLECATCEASALGQEAIACALIALVIFAVIGIFVCVIAGVMFVQYIVQKHVHVLHKWAMSKDYIVADLSPGGIPIAAMRNKVSSADSTGGGGSSSTPGRSANSSYTAGSSTSANSIMLSNPLHSREFMLEESEAKHMDTVNTMDFRRGPAAFDMEMMPTTTSVTDIRRRGLDRGSTLASTSDYAELGMGSQHDESEYSHSRASPTPSAPPLTPRQVEELRSMGLL